MGYGWLIGLGILAAAIRIGRAFLKNRLLRHVDWVATVSTLGALLFWSLGPVFIKYIAGSIDSWTQNGLRYGIATVFWLPYLLIAIKRGDTSSGLWVRALLPALFNMMMQVSWTAAFYYLSPTFVSLLAKLSVLWVALFSMIMFADERRLLGSWPGCERKFPI